MTYFALPASTIDLPEPDGAPYRSLLTPAAAGGFLDIQVGDPSDGFYPGYSPSPVIAQLVGPGGYPGTPFEILAGGGATVDHLDVTQLDTGGWLVTARMSGDPEIFAPRMAVQVLGPGGQPAGDPVFFTDPSTDFYLPLDPATTSVTMDPGVFFSGGPRGGAIPRWDMVARPDGTIVVAGTYHSGGVHEMRLQVYDAAGTAIGARQTIPLVDSAYGIQLTAARNGDVLITWNPTPTTTALATYPVGGTLTAYRSSGITGDEIVHVSDDGQITTAWNTYIPSEWTTGGTYSFWMQTGTVDGFADPVLISSYISESSNEYIRYLEPLGNGLFAVIRAASTSSYPGPATDHRVTVSVLDADGWRYGSTDILTDAMLGGNAATITGAMVQDGRLIVTADTGPWDTADRVVGMLAMPDEVSGSAGDDTLAVTSASFVRAGAGDDHVTGSALGDVLDGGAGNDTLLGGGGDDILRMGPGTGLADGGAGQDLLHLDVFDRMYGDYDRPAALVYADLFTLDPDGTLHFSYGAADLTLRSIEEVSFNGYSARYGSIVSALFRGPDQEYRDLSRGTPTEGRTYNAGPGDDRVIGTPFGDRLYLGTGDDQVNGGLGADELHGEDGHDWLHGSDPLDNPTGDRSDTIFAGAGNDTLFGGHGNDVLYGMEDDDLLSGGFGADFLAGQTGQDTLSGGALSDRLFGNDGSDFLNGGFGHDRLNGGAGADRFFHLGTRDHGSDWVQDYSAADGDVLVFGGSAARDQFQVNFAAAGAGDAAVDEAFVIHRPTGQILWALIDGGGQGAINLMLGGTQVDLLSEIPV